MTRDEELQAILDIGVALSAETDANKLFNLIITNGMQITNCDAGTLYLCGDDVLEFRIMKTLSMGVDAGKDGEKIDIPPVPMREENICAYAAIHKKPLNIPDVYNSDRFDFSGPKRYDSMTGYKTGSMLAIPLVNTEDVTVGVLQLMNAKDEEGNTIPFDKRLEEIVFALASQTAIAVTNMRYSEELKEQMWSFTEAMAAAIDERTPYNASHTRKVAHYCGLIVDHINELHFKGQTDEYFSPNRKEQLVMGALLHDIGKLVTPLEVMNKATRLGGREHLVEERLTKYSLLCKVDFLEGRITEEKYNEVIAKIDEALAVAKEINDAGFVGDELTERLSKVIDLTYKDEPFFLDEEKKCLRIKKGTLTDEERKVMEGHVEITAKILSKVHFNSYFTDSPIWAAEHHECLNGKGYPNHLTEESLPLDARIIAVADICDALLATDRPYKKPLPKEKAFAILRDMASAGNIDAQVVEYLAECID